MKKYSQKILRFIKNHFQILKYLICSIITAIIEIIIGWILLNVVPYKIMISNTIAIVFGAIIHYFITLKFVFNTKNNWKSIVIYLISFVLGIFSQDIIIWIFYDIILKSQNEFVRYFLSKGISLVVPFFLLYYIRKTLNQMIRAQNEK